MLGSLDSSCGLYQQFLAADAPADAGRALLPVMANARAEGWHCQCMQDASRQASKDRRLGEEVSDEPGILLMIGWLDSNRGAQISACRSWHEAAHRRQSLPLVDRAEAR
ncbi:hypothetical protein VA603_16730 [Stenotrophomonas sp. MH1]|uniref:Uncharacterized protein n=1 Tax=Stenotrophomonas capsici TaxID=3110230 RepID=A0ABU5V749_9GAMM|nr:hypothetical protein [Stenotrophomonas sp. MH1]MEA5669181.1 hypothetical protein [Stenotrophomonas sp. MH1]